MSAIHRIKDAPCNLEYIRQRCREVDDCWIWVRETKHANLPRIWFRRPDVDGVVRDFELFVRHVVVWIATKERPDVGKYKVWRPTCGNELCVNPKHIQMFTKSEMNSMFSGMRKAVNKAKIAKARRKNSKLSDADVREIRHSDDPQAELAARYGVTQQHVCLIQKGATRREYVNPWAGLGA